MKSDIEFSADNDGNIVVTQTTVMTTREFLALAGEVYRFSNSMVRGIPTPLPQLQAMERPE